MESPHVVVLAFPAQGHVNGAMDFSRKLAELGVSITFVCTEAYIAGTMKQGFDVHVGGLPIRLHSLQPSEETHSKLSDTVDHLGAVIRESETMASAFEALLKELRLSDNGVACIVHDAVLSWVAWLGKRLAIPAYMFYPCSAALCSFGIHTLDFPWEGRLPLIIRPDTDLSEKSNVFTIAGFPPLHASELPTTSCEPSPICSLDFWRRIADACLHAAAGALINSVYELEKEVVDAMRKKAPAMEFKTVGPLLPSSFLRGEVGGAEGEDAQRCLEWLDEQPAASVLYVAFGTIACLSQEQAEELALGLEESRARFLWVVRVPGAGAGDDDQPLLPRGFEERTKGQGLVLWAMAPQRKILGHRAVGAFLTHCGWNSMLESLCRGVPMLCCPVFGDQHMNAKWVVEVVQAGKPLKRGDDGIARKEEVASMVRATLDDTALRESAARTRDAVCRAALDPRGSSCSSLQAFVRSLSHANHNKPLDQ